MIVEKIFQVEKGKLRFNLQGLHTKPVIFSKTWDFFMRKNEIYGFIWLESVVNP